MVTVMLRVAVSCLILWVVIDASVLKFQPHQDVIRTNQMEDTAVNQMEDPPKFCNKLDCPKYSLVKKTKDYEVRKYVATHWVSTNLAGSNYNLASYTLFMRLFRYIQGNNKKKEKIEMTTPVLIQITPGQGPTCANNFTMSFFNSPKVPDPPKPSDPTVYLSSMPAMTVYVATFGGYSTQSVFLEKAAALQAALEKDKLSFVKDHYFTAGYNSPFQVLHRHNEIWFLAK